MTQKLEKLSAWIDGEQQQDMVADLQGDQQLADKWQRYHLIGQALRKELPSQIDLDLSDNIAAALANEPAIVAPKRRWQDVPVLGAVARNVTPLFHQSGQLAIAASVAVAVIIGVQQMNQPEELPYSPASPLSSPLGGLSPVSLQQTRATGRLGAQEQHRLINAYLNDHRMQLRMKTQPVAKVAPQSESDKKADTGAPEQSPE